MRKKPSLLRSIFFVFALVGISAGIVSFSYSEQLRLLSKPILEINPETYSPQVKSSIEKGTIVRISGTPNLLIQVSQEPSKDVKNPIIYHYAALKEYGFDFVVRIKRSKLNSKFNTFQGKVLGINDTEFGNRIKNGLNKEINFADQVNKELSSEIDDAVKKLIAVNSAGQFSNDALLVLDEEVLDYYQLYQSLITNTVLLSIFFIAVFKRSIFG
ncbi:hypothetical protein D6810_01325 [Candidatus Dojkabacteria bacterium]|uniref:Uncharacterized protein n=1 Tax=Candidatus Dojkabacteria bacterium TaxID=2099670 RepID=A0A3M0Z2P2_9BACT|nr:MAG: hypothetical protein D6810_01325 [Candidatus Dojkabacteria bacterium]